MELLVNATITWVDTNEDHRLLRPIPPYLGLP